MKVVLSDKFQDIVSLWDMKRYPKELKKDI